MIILCTDYGCSLYTGQVHAKILARNNRVKVINGIDDLPAFNIRASAYLLDALIDHYPADAIFIAVVDPGVGSDRAPVYLQLENRWFVGPDNGIFSRVFTRSEAQQTEVIRIDTTKISGVSHSFHGRDVFAPVAAMLAEGIKPPGTPINDSVTRMLAQQWPANLDEVIYVDTFGNCMTGIRADSMQRTNTVEVGSSRFSFAETFSSRPGGSGLWYVNSLSLAEIAASQASAADVFGINVGDKVKVIQN